jgi:hypothetical protein
MPLSPILVSMFLFAESTKYLAVATEHAMRGCGGMILLIRASRGGFQGIGWKTLHFDSCMPGVTWVVVVGWFLQQGLPPWNIEMQPSRWGNQGLVMITHAYYIMPRSIIYISLSKGLYEIHERCFDDALRWLPRASSLSDRTTSFCSSKRGVPMHSDGAMLT